MQQFVARDSDNQNKNSSTSRNNTTDRAGEQRSTCNSTNSMPPQVQLQGQITAMQEIHQPFQPQQLTQLNQLHHNWGGDHQQQQQPAGDLLSIRTSLEPSSETASATTNQGKIGLNRSASPTNVSLGSTSIKSSGSSSRVNNNNNNKSSMSKSNSGIISSPSLSSASPPAFYGTTKMGSGVEIKGPTQEVAQQLRFPWKLHLLLERCEYEHQQKLAAAAAEGTSPNRVPDMPISWLPSGKAFKVHDKERFVKEVMPSFFGTQSFKTFQRNLNLWGFTRVSKGPQKDVCSHPLFLKGFPAVCQSMKRIVLKGTGRGNRAPLGGVDVSSVQAVVAAAAMQQAQQQQAAQQHHHHHQQNFLGPSAATSGMGFNPIQTQQVLQQQMKTSNDVLSPQASNALSHINLQNPQQGQIQNQYGQHQQQQQQQQFVIENGTIQAAPLAAQQKLVVLPSASPVPSSATTTVMWPNNQPQLQQQDQQFSMADANMSLQKSLSQLSTIIQQLNGCNTVTTATVNNNTVHGAGGGNAGFQQQQQQQQVNPTPMLQQQQQQPILMQQQQQQQNPNAVVTPSPMSTQDLVSLLLQRNLQQQISQAPSQTTTPGIQLQVPSSLFPSQNSMQQQQQQQQPPGSVVVNNGAFGANSSGFVSQQQQVGNTTGMFSAQQQQQQQQQPNLSSPSPTPSANQQQQNQLLQLLLQQNGWSTSSAPNAPI